MKSHLAAWCALLLSAILWSSDPAVAAGRNRTDARSAAEPRITVLSPMGTPPPIHQLAMAPRLGSLDGKTIYIVDDGFPGGEVLLSEMAAWFNRNMPKTTVIFRRKAGPFEAEDPALFAEIKAKGDAVIMGMGH